METFDEKAAVLKYLRLMHELEMRIELVARACTGALNLPPPFAREYCFLQFRRMCELMALGCLQLHGDLPSAKTTSASKEWHAERIMKLLHRSHAHSFPQSLTVTKTDVGQKFDTNSKPNALTYAEFNTLYNRCGEVLHRGTIRTLEAEIHLDKPAYDEVISWSHKIVDLLNEHLITRSDRKAMYHVSLKTEVGGLACSVLFDFSDNGLRVETYRIKLPGYNDEDDGEPVQKMVPTAYASIEV